MRVAVFPADRSACGYYRLIFGAQALAAQGADVAINPGETWKALMQETSEGSQVVDILNPPDADVVVIQRPLKLGLVQGIEHLQRKGIAVVVEVDDDFSCIPPSNAVWNSHHPRLNRESNWRNISEACKVADLVTVSTPALAQRYGPKCVVIPNYIPEHYLKIDRQAVRNEMRPSLEDKLRIGWTGTPTTHGGDLEQCGDAVAQVCRDTGATFRAIGSQTTHDILGIPEGKRETAAWTDLLNGYLRQLATLDIGIAPLADTAFNRAKSWLKCLEYAALGIPWVASPLPEYSLFGVFGGGYLADRSREWTRHLRAFAVDEDLWQGASEAGRQRAAGLTVEGNCERWWNAWEMALRRRKTTISRTLTS